MNAFWKDPKRRELVVAAAAGAVWALLGAALAARGAESNSCRVHNNLAGATNVGSGTLIDVTAGGRAGLVLTCAHLFAEGCGRVVVTFPDGRSHAANVIGIDRQADLAALEIANPRAAPAPIALAVDAAGPLTACGFGGDGRRRCVAGRVLGVSQAPGQESVRIAGAVRSGDSGGGVFDPQGRLVAVVWGESGGVTYASTGGPLRQFLQRVLGRRIDAPTMSPSVAPSPICPDGQCPLVAPAPIGVAPPAGRAPAAGGEMVGVEPPASDGCACGKDCACDGRLDAQFDALASKLDGLAPLVGGAAKAAGPLAVSILGISGPAGWAVLAGTAILSGVIGRRFKSRAARRQARAGDSEQLAPRASQLAPAREGSAAAEHSFRVETHAPIERDDREARELLRLSQLEGRDPLQDALAGRLALDRLDALAEGDADPQRARWADELRRELRDRFNDVAPTRFQIKAES